MNILGFNFSFGKAQKATEVIGVDELTAYSGGSAWEQSSFTGEKFFGGFGETQLYQADYWTLRKRSSQLFTDNLYARGLIRRLITNEINTGLTPEACPDEEIIGVKEDSLNDWTETIENRFNVWAKAPQVCDWKREQTFGAIQRATRTEALVSGDVLVVLRQHPLTKMPSVQLVRGDSVLTPLATDTKIRSGHSIAHGVELDAQKRHVAFWVRQEDNSYKRLPAYGEKSGRKLAWLVYGTDKRLDDVRGQPILSIVLQSLKEIDRYRDSAQRKAVINSILTMIVTKSQDKMGTLPISGGATRRDSATVTDGDGSNRTFNLASQLPGFAIEELQQGEDVVLKGGEGIDVNFGEFEEAIIQSVAWANEMPPEILKLAFSNNYSASQAAINEFKIYLNKIWSEFGEQFCSPIYVEFMVSAVLTQKIDAPGLLQAWRDPSQYDVFGAWTLVDWYGSIKPSTDMLKQAKGSKLLVDNLWSTNAREARITTGTKFSKNAKRVKRENELLVAAARPMADFKQEYGEAVADEALSAVDESVITAIVEDILDDRGGDDA